MFVCRECACVRVCSCEADADIFFSREIALRLNNIIRSIFSLLDFFCEFSLNMRIFLNAPLPYRSSVLCTCTNKVVLRAASACCCVCNLTFFFLAHALHKCKPDASNLEFAINATSNFWSGLKNAGCKTATRKKRNSSETISLENSGCYTIHILSKKCDNFSSVRCIYVFNIQKYLSRITVFNEFEIGQLSYVQFSHIVYCIRQ